MTRTIKVNGTEYAAKITELHHDNNWGGRSAMMLRLTMSAAEAAALLPAGAKWSIVLRDTVPIYDDNGLQTGSQEAVTETDMSEYCLAGQITDHRDGTVSIKMGKATEVETLRAQLEDAERAAKILLGEEK